MFCQCGFPIGSDYNRSKSKFRNNILNKECDEIIIKHENYALFFYNVVNHYSTNIDKIPGYNQPMSQEIFVATRKCD